MRPALALILLCACDDVYPMLPTMIGDGGPVATTNGGTGGNGGGDGSSRTTDLSEPVPGLVVARSSTRSFGSARFGGSCTTVAVGSNCTLEDCAADGGTQARAPDAGNIHFTGTLFPIALVPEVDGSYATVSVSGALWNSTSGQLTINAAGDSVPAFVAQLSPPTAIDVTNPLTASAITLARSSDFNFFWAGGSVGQVQAQIAVNTVTLTCGYDRTVDSGVIPTAVLSLLPSGGGTLTIVTASSSTVGGQVLVRAETPGLDSSGAPFVATLTLQ